MLKTEEKLTDVNLAVHMVHDSDLAEPLSIVRPIRHKHLRAAQFPDVVNVMDGVDRGSEVRKPDGW